MQKYGTNYGGWLIPQNINLNENSVVYSAGVGEDISFDLILSHLFKCKIHLIDPTTKAVKHFKKIKRFYTQEDYILSGGIQHDYIPIIKNLKPQLNSIVYHNVGLWDSEGSLKFYKQKNRNYVSQSLVENMFGDSYDIVDVKPLSKLMEENNHTAIDLLKLDIEGAEINVLNNMLDNKIYPRYLCVEFDLYLKKKDVNNETKTVISRLLQSGYKIIGNDNYNITFVR